MTRPQVFITRRIPADLSALEAREKMATMAIENLIAGLKGDRVPSCVNASLYQSA